MKLRSLRCQNNEATRTLIRTSPNAVDRSWHPVLPLESVEFHAKVFVFCYSTVDCRTAFFSFPFVVTFVTYLEVSFFFCHCFHAEQNSGKRAFCLQAFIICWSNEHLWTRILACLLGWRHLSPSGCCITVIWVGADGGGESEILRGWICVALSCHRSILEKSIKLRRRLSFLSFGFDQLMFLLSLENSRKKKNSKGRLWWSRRRRNWKRKIWSWWKRTRSGEKKCKGQFMSSSPGHFGASLDLVFRLGNKYKRR